MPDQDNGAEKSRVEGVLRFLGLAGMQMRGRPTRATQPQEKPSPEALRESAITALLLADPPGAEILLGLLKERIEMANLDAHATIREHAICAGFLGAEAALRRLHDDLNRLRGQA